MIELCHRDSLHKSAHADVRFHDADHPHALKYLLIPEGDPETVFACGDTGANGHRSFNYIRQLNPQFRDGYPRRAGLDAELLGQSFVEMREHPKLAGAALLLHLDENDVEHLPFTNHGEW